MAVPAVAQQSEKPMLLKASLLYASETYNNDQYIYNGGKTRGIGYELGYDYAMPDHFSYITPWIGYARFIGNPRPELASIQPGGAAPPRFDLTAWRAGLDFKWDTPVKNLRGWMGINLNFFDGNQLSAGKVYASDTDLTPKPVNESRAKWGVRAGLDYQFTPEWSASAQFDAGQWLSYNTSGAGSKARLKAYNPMNPSWFALSVGYHF
jgi:hypothetical protein